MKPPGFFDVEGRLALLIGLGGQLEAFSRAVGFEVFRPILEKALAYSDGQQGSRPPFDTALTFKILVIQMWNNLSDEQTEYLMNDRLFFMRFLVLWRTIGKVQGVTTLFVVHTEPVKDENDGEEYGRIISVRKATAHERETYENGP